MILGRILNDSNEFIPCTNLEGAASVTQTDFLPLGLVGNNNEGELLLKVNVISSGTGTAAQQVQGTAADNAVAFGNPVYTGGLAVNATTYAPAYTAGDAAAIAIDKDTGAQLVGVIGRTGYVTTTPTLSVGGAAATGDYVGTTTTPQSFALAVRNSGGTGVIKSIAIVDKLTTAAVALELWVFSATFTAPTDNAAWSISDADALNCLGVIPIGTDKWYASALNKVYSSDALSMVIKPAATSLFYAIVARGTTPAWATGDLQISLGILQD